MKCLRNADFYINYCCYKLIIHKDDIGATSTFISMIVISLFTLIYPLYTSFNLNKIELCIKNPAEYFNLINNTTYIAKYCKENQRDFINIALNFTDINNLINFENDFQHFRIYNIVNVIIISI